MCLSMRETSSCVGNLSNLSFYLLNFQKIPDGDVFIHAGDFTRGGQLSEVRDFNNWLAQVSLLITFSVIQCVFYSIVNKNELLGLSRVLLLEYKSPPLIFF